MNDIVIPTYIINVPKRTDRLKHILEQFENKHEFEINIIKASEHRIGAVGLWQSICRVINIATEKDEDVIILCEDGHQFTKYYDKNKLIKAIYDAHKLNANFLTGGIISEFSNLLPIKSGLSWLYDLSGTQFVVIFRSFFEIILNEPFSESDTVDGKFTEITGNKFIIFPMISTQKYFEYSDIADNDSSSNNRLHQIQQTALRMKKIHDVHEQALKYKTH